MSTYVPDTVEGVLASDEAQDQVDPRYLDVQAQFPTEYLNARTITLPSACRNNYAHTVVRALWLRRMGFEEALVVLKRKQP